MTKTEV